MSRYKFQEDEVPYAILEEFGLTQEMIEDLPTDVYHDILNGRLSPVLPISLTDKEGGTVSARARFKLVRDAAENADVIFHPRLVRTELDRYSPEEQEALRSGKAGTKRGSSVNQGSSSSGYRRSGSMSSSSSQNSGYRSCTSSSSYSRSSSGSSYSGSSHSSGGFSGGGGGSSHSGGSGGGGGGRR